MSELTVGTIVKMLKGGMVTEDTPICLVSEEGFAEIGGMCGDERRVFISHDAEVLVSKYCELMRYAEEEEEDVRQYPLNTLL